jgi:hypothetical protein
MASISSLSQNPSLEKEVIKVAWRQRDFALNEPVQVMELEETPQVKRIAI